MVECQLINVEGVMGLEKKSPFGSHYNDNEFR